VGQETATAGWGVSLRCAPGRAARAVGNDTAVANRAGPTAARHASVSAETMVRAVRRVPGPPGAHPSRTARSVRFDSISCHRIQTVAGYRLVEFTSGAPELED